MAFGINACNAKRIRSYEDAAALFNVPLNTRSADWNDNMRPLDGLRKPHMHVLRGKDYYDVVLYQIGRASCRERVSSPV